MVYPALLPLTHTPRLPVVDWTDAPADLNGLVRFAARRSLVSVHVSSHFKRSLVRRLEITYQISPQQSSSLTVIVSFLCTTTIARRVVVIPYRRFGTTYRSYFQGSRSVPSLRIKFSRLLKMGRICCPKT